MADALHLISTVISEPATTLHEVVLSVDRHTLAKRIWRGVAEDGTEFGFELERPLRPGEIFFQSETTRYVVRQLPEPVVEIALAMAPAAAAGIGWAVGNLHLELQAESTRLLAPDEPAVRQLLTRLDVPFRPTTAVFCPGRFARGGLPTHELGAGHKH